MLSLPSVSAASTNCMAILKNGDKSPAVNCIKDGDHYVVTRCGGSPCKVEKIEDRSNTCGPTEPGFKEALLIPEVGNKGKLIIFTGEESGAFSLASLGVLGDSKIAGQMADRVKDATLGSTRASTATAEATSTELTFAMKLAKYPMIGVTLAGTKFEFLNSVNPVVSSDITKKTYSLKVADEIDDCK